MSRNDNQFEPLENSMKILQLIEKDVLPIDTKWFNHLPIHNKKDLPTDFVSCDYPQLISYPFLKVEPKKLDQSKNNQFTTSFSQ